MKEKIANLIDLKSIVTLSLTIALVVGFFMGKIPDEKLTEFVLMVFAFYFGKADSKKEEQKVETKQLSEHEAE